jgi:hypothetical protein
VKPAAAKPPSKASASPIPLARMQAKLVASPNEQTRSSWRRSQRQICSSAGGEAGIAQWNTL